MPEKYEENKEKIIRICNKATEQLVGKHKIDHEYRYGYILFTYDDKEIVKLPLTMFYMSERSIANVILSVVMNHIGDIYGYIW